MIDSNTVLGSVGATAFGSDVVETVVQINSDLFLIGDGSWFVNLIYDCLD